jgi:hypothetical protein
VLAGIVLVLALFLVRPGAQRLRTRIVRSISLALGRPVDVGSVTLRLLPQPGFDLENFVVHEDPEFGAEPVLQSSEVVAIVRVSSLLRGRLEIARLSLTEPSINLVRNGEGRWNLEKLVERASSTPVAPTSKARSEARPGFPYIEADHGRINFKFGQEKKPYSLTEANFALWQDSENTWGMRLRAQPMRTDFNLSDTGLLAMDGWWQRAADLHETPVQFTLQWEGAQLGQATKLTLGQDKGWRGSVRLSAQLTGTPKNLTVKTEGAIEDFRRYDISGDPALRLAVRCNGHYSSTDHVLSGLACSAPVGEGSITLSGSIAPMPGSRAYDLTVLVENLPLQPMVELARRVKKNLPADIVAAGKMDASITLRRTSSTGAGLAWQGGGEVLALSLRSPLTNTRLALDKIPFTISSSSHDDRAMKSGAERSPGSSVPPRMGPRLDVGPFNLALGRTPSATVHGQVSRSGYNFMVQGDADIQRMLEVARMVGLPAPAFTASGDARVSLHMGGGWAGFAAASVTGTAQLHAIHARVRGLTEPVEVSSASLELMPASTEVRKLTAAVAGNTWRGSLSIPRPCEKPQACTIRVDLHTDEFATDNLSGQVNALPGEEPWYRFLSSQAQSKPYLATLHAVGKLTANRVVIHNLAATRVSAEVELEQGRLHLSNLRGDVMDGRHTGEWQADFTMNPPTFQGHGTLETIALEQIAEAMHDPWITGTATIDYSADAAGWTKAELFSHADAAFQLEAREGSLPHLTLAGDNGPVRINHFTGRLLLRAGKFEMDRGKLQTPGGIYQLSGIASPGRVLDFNLARDGARGFNITGTLEQPRVAVSTVPDTQAALKP